MDTGHDDRVFDTPGHDQSGQAAIEIAGVDERGQVEDALRASEERYRQALVATEAALAKAQALYHISSSQIAAETLETLLQRVVEVVAKALPADRVNLFAIDSARRSVNGNYLGGPGGQELAEIDYDEVMEGLGGCCRSRRA
jgi:hypothetical protein